MSITVSTFEDVIDRIHAVSTTNRDIGTGFERLVAEALRKDPYYGDLFDQVWLWRDWPHRQGLPDTGIDLVAHERVSGGFVAIQAKCFEASHSVQKSEIDSFFTASGQGFRTPEGPVRFSRRIIVTTTNRWSKNADRALMDQDPPVTRLSLRDLLDLDVDWGALWQQISSAHAPTLPSISKQAARPHQLEAIAKVLDGFATQDRGKLIMACGTGKTLVAQRVAESVVKESGLVVFFAPSISLVSQALREWLRNSEIPFHAFAVCSDTKVGRDEEDMGVRDLFVPATTNAERLVTAIKAARMVDPRPLTVIFSTYQSISVLVEAQAELGLTEFDLVVCDEAHRTTGVILQNGGESQFVKVHNNTLVRSKRRLYMTATPRLYGDAAKQKAERVSAVLCSMDDETLFGPEFHRLGFGEAVARGLLSDYKVLVLAVDEQAVSGALQRGLADRSNELKLPDAVKIVGCWTGLSRTRLEGEEEGQPMRRAVAYSHTIRHSKKIAEMFQTVIDEYLGYARKGEPPLRCEVHHVDGSQNVLDRNRELDWLRQPSPEGECRILTNARCLSEGIDVPALDAVLFLNPRDSQVDVVQSVGRVMRRAPGKDYGYIILPVGIPAGVAPEEALNQNEKYEVVWKVLQALRAHDDRFNAMINQIDLNKERPGQFQIIGVGGSGDGKPTDIQLAFPDLEGWKDAIYAKVVLKCGDRRYWEDWARDVADIARHHIERIRTLVTDPRHREAFQRYVDGLRKNINPFVSDDEAIEMLAQHAVTRPVFDAIFESYAFASHNAVSKSLQEVLDVIEAEGVSKEAESLRGFYESVRTRVRGIDNLEGRQRVIVELYNRFFKLAFPRMHERLGIVYTPVEIVDFINRSAEHALQKTFGVGLTDDGVHILDPFTGTGTFIVRLLTSGLIKPEDLRRKYATELHANEIVLLAYYIAAVNIEEAFHSEVGGGYQPFEGILLTDTFQLSESAGEIVDSILPDNSERVEKQKRADIRVIVANPPYSVGQRSQNDNAKNLHYDALDSRVRATYADKSRAGNKRNLYDSYVRAIRWASDRIGDRGVIGYVTNGSFIEGTFADGLRKCLADEFSEIYCLNVRGNANTQGPRRQREGGNVFGEGTKTGIAITILVKDPEGARPARIHFHAVDDGLSREDKLRWVAEVRDITGVEWQTIRPNEYGEWVGQRSPEFDSFMALGDKHDASEPVLYSTYSGGVLSGRDAWAINFSRGTLERNMKRMIDAFNEETDRFLTAHRSGLKPNVDNFVDSDPRKISWTVNLKRDLETGRTATFTLEAVRRTLYRPFVKKYLYFDRRLNERVLLIPSLFPTPEAENQVIICSGVGATKEFSAIMTDALPNYHTLDTCQCFPLFRYREIPADGLHSQGEDMLVRESAISKDAVREFRGHYKDPAIGEEDIFYYVYGVLHSPEYRKRYSDTLRRTLPRIPFASDFWAFSRAGRELASLHVGYERVEPWPLAEEVSARLPDDRANYRVEKMSQPKGDRSTVIYNPRITLRGIPEDAYSYVVNGRSAINWLIEKYCIETDQASGITNDPNLWSDDPRYVLDLVKRVVRVSMETVRIIRGLPELGIEGDPLEVSGEQEPAS